LSDDELLKILSNTESKNINDYIKKIFENIDKLSFDEEGFIYEMSSKDGENVDFLEKISPKD